MEGRKTKEYAAEARIRGRRRTGVLQKCAGRSVSCGTWEVGGVWCTSETEGMIDVLALVSLHAMANKHGHAAKSKYDLCMRQRLRRIVETSFH